MSEREREREREREKEIERGGKNAVITFLITFFAFSPELLLFHPLFWLSVLPLLLFSFSFFIEAFQIVLWLVC